MQVQKISFTSVQNPEQNKENKQSSLYNKKNITQIAAMNDFIAGSAVAFGVLESRNKFKLLKKLDKPAETLKQIAKSKTKLNIALGLLIGAIYTAVDMLAFKKLAPKFENMYDKIEEVKQNSSKE